MSHTTLPARLRAAAVVLEELSALAGYKEPSVAPWDAVSLRHEAQVLEDDSPCY